MTPRFKIVVSSRLQEDIFEQLNGMARIDLGLDAKRDGIIARQTV